MSGRDRILRALARPGRRLMIRGGELAVQDRGDRRTRPVLVVEEAERLRLLDEGMIEAAVDRDGWVISRPGLQRLAARRPGGEAAGGVILTAPPRSPGGGAGLAGLLRRRAAGEDVLSERALAGARRLIVDAELAASVRGLTMNWSAVAADRRRRRSGSEPSGGVAAAARRRLRVVAGAVDAADWGVAWAACGEAAGLGAIERRFGMRAGGGVRALKVALERVADAYDRCAPPEPETGGIRS